MQRRVASIKDQAGMPVDPGIADTVVLLNLFEIRTVMSCEGHIDRGAAPWVYIEDEGARALEAQVERVVAKAREGISRETECMTDEEMALFEQVRESSLAVKQHQMQHQLKLFDLLAAFYADRHVPFDQQLYVRPYHNGASRLESHGAAMQDAVSQAVRYQRLLAYQQEMQAFTDFLKARYFAQT
jgi:hypothetical protein